MDANRQAYFLIREAEEFSHRATRIRWDGERKALVLAQNQRLRLPESDSEHALLRHAETHALLVDEFQQQARIAASGDQIEYNAGRGFLPLVDGDLNLVDAPLGHFTDLSIGGDGRLAAGYTDGAIHGVLVFHLTKRWQAAASLQQAPMRVAIDDHNQIWCLSQSHISCCAGEPLPHRYEPHSTRFEPVDLNPNALTLVWQQPLPETDLALALATHQQTLGVLVHHGDGQQTLLTRSTQLSAAGWGRFRVDEACPFAIDLAFTTPDRVALMAPRAASDAEFVQRDCPLVQLFAEPDSEQGEARLQYERLPMLSQVAPRFVRGQDGKVRYQADVAPQSQQAESGFTVYPRQLQSLRRPRYYTSAISTLTTPLDGGSPDTHWHRIYLEGCIPSGCKVVVYAKTYNVPSERTSTPFVRQPQWHFEPIPSEQAFGRGVVENKAGEQGLFSLLLQKHSGAVRRFTGRYLQLRLRLESNGFSTPAVQALKVVYPRMSYQERYLPEHFRQEQSVHKADIGHANGADFRERMLAAFEGVLTPLEGVVSNAEVLLNPAYAPPQHLAWLAELFGQTLPTSWPVSRQRRWLCASGDLQKWRGTLRGVQLALDIVTDGGIGRGQVVVVENFRLRRTMATLLGLNMDDSEHPLTLGTGESGNSLIGDSLILSDADSREFLALFAEEVTTQSDDDIVEAFFDRYAHRVSVLLHGPAMGQRQQVEDMLAQQMPATVQWKIVESDHPFILGLSPLLAVDTYLEEPSSPRPVVLSDTYLSKEGLLTNPTAFSPQDANGQGVAW